MPCSTVVRPVPSVITPSSSVSASSSWSFGPSPSSSGCAEHDRDDRDRRDRQADAGQRRAEREVQARLQPVEPRGRPHRREAFGQQHERGDDDADDRLRHVAQSTTGLERWCERFGEANDRDQRDKQQAALTSAVVLDGGGACASSRRYSAAGSSRDGASSARKRKRHRARAKRPRQRRAARC